MESILLGRVDEARADLDQALRLDPKNATAYALQSVIAMVQNEQEQALYLARKAEELDPQSAIPKVAYADGIQSKTSLPGKPPELFTPLLTEARGGGNNH